MEDYDLIEIGIHQVYINVYMYIDNNQCIQQNVGLYPRDTIEKHRNKKKQSR